MSAWWNWAYERAYGDTSAQEKADEDADFESQREAFHDTRRADFEREVYARCDREDSEPLAQLTQRAE